MAEDDIYSSLYQMWAGRSPYSLAAASHGALTQYQKLQLEESHKNKELARAVAKQKAVETARHHYEQEEEKRMQLAISLQAKIADWQNKREVARQKYIDEYQKRQHDIMAMWQKDTASIANAKSGENKSYWKEYGNAVASFLNIVEKGNLRSRQLHDKALNQILNPTDPQNRQAKYPGVPPRWYDTIGNWVRKYNELDPSTPEGQADRESMIKEYHAQRQKSLDYQQGKGAETQEDRAALIKAREEAMPRYDLRDAVAYANSMADTELGRNPYDQEAINSMLRKKPAQMPALEIGGYVSGKGGTTIVPTQGATAEEMSAINKWNASQESKQLKQGEVVSNEDMAARLEKFLRK